MKKSGSSGDYQKRDILDFPLPYYTEIMTGFEYNTAAHMLYEGQTENGLTILKGSETGVVATRGILLMKGNGHRYARAMASWAGILGYTGFYFSEVDKSMHFNPREGSFFWSNGYQYGLVNIKPDDDKMQVSMKCLNGDLELNNFSLNNYGEELFQNSLRIPKGEEVFFFVSRSK